MSGKWASPLGLGLADLLTGDQDTNAARMSLYTGITVEAAHKYINDMRALFASLAADVSSLGPLIQHYQQRDRSRLVTRRKQRRNW